MRFKVFIKVILNDLHYNVQETQLSKAKSVYVPHQRAHTCLYCLALIEPAILYNIVIFYYLLFQLSIL